jgi:catechol 2,3-dioxygenase-like lactoylglutathione lyase family enzyme
MFSAATVGRKPGGNGGKTKQMLSVQLGIIAARRLIGEAKAMAVNYQGTLIAVKDIERSRLFYQQLLGLEVTADFGANITLSGGIFLQTVETWQNFIRLSQQQIVFANHAMELYFETDDMEAFLARLAAFSDIVYVHPLIEHAWGQRAVRFYDPDWHIIEVGESITKVVKRFIAGGLSVMETAARMDVPPDYVSACLQA